MNLFLRLEGSGGQFFKISLHILYLTCREIVDNETQFNLGWLAPLTN